MIKTIKENCPNRFDRKVNAALEEGWGFLGTPNHFVWTTKEKGQYTQTHFRYSVTILKDSKEHLDGWAT